MQSIIKRAQLSKGYSTGLFQMVTHPVITPSQHELTLVKKWEVMFSFGKSKLLIFFYFLFVAPPSNIATSSDQNITAPAELTLNCSAEGKPEPKISWTRVSDNTAVTMPVTISRGKNEESYRCTANNGVGIPLTKDVNITILCE